MCAACRRKHLKMEIVTEDFKASIHYFNDSKTSIEDSSEFIFYDIEPQTYETILSEHQQPTAIQKAKLNFVKLIPEDREKLAKLAGTKLMRPALPVSFTDRKPKYGNVQPKLELQTENKNGTEELSPLAESTLHLYKCPVIESGSSKQPTKPKQKSTVKPAKNIPTQRLTRARKKLTTNQVHSTGMSAMEGQLVQLIKKLDPNNLPKDFSRAVHDMALTLTKKYKLDANHLTKEWYRTFLTTNAEILDIASIVTNKHLPPSTVDQQNGQQLTHKHNAEIVDRIIGKPVEMFKQDFYATVMQIANDVAQKYNVSPALNGQQKCYALMADFPLLIAKKQAVNKFRSENPT